MAAFLDVCRFTPAAGGTADWTYSAAVTGYQSPTAASVVNSRVYKYRAESADLSQWEVGEGAYNTGTGVLARTTVLFNSSGGTSKINFSVAPQVSIVALKEDLISIEEANTFTTAQKAQARSNIGVDVATRTITGADTLIASDRGKLILFNSAAAFTAAITAAATLGDGWWCRFRNIGAGPVTIDPDSSELVDGATTTPVGLNDSGELHCTGSAFYTEARPASVLLGGLTASASAALDFTGMISTAYRRYVLSIEQLIPATDDVYLYMKVGTGAGPTIQSSSYGFASRTQIEGTGVDNGSNAALDNISTLIALGRPGAGNGIGNTATYGISGHIEFVATGLGDFVYFNWSVSYGRTGGGLLTFNTGGGYWKAGTDITAVRLGMSSGAITSGQARLYGYRR